MSAELEFIPWLYQALGKALGSRKDPFRLSAGVISQWAEFDVSCLPALYALHRRGSDLFGEGVGGRIVEVARHSVARNLVQLTEAATLFEVLNASGLRWVVIKGADALARIYPGPEWRRMLDLDLLVHPEDLDEFMALLLVEGMNLSHESTPATAPGIELVRGHLHLDVHRGLSHGFPGDEGRVSWLLEEWLEGELLEVPVRLMEPARAFAAAALLVAKDIYLPQLVRPLRLAELALTADHAGRDAEGNALNQLRQQGAERIAQRTHDLIGWLRGGSPPDWLDSGYGKPQAIADGLPSRPRRLFAAAGLVDDSWSRIGYIVRRSVLHALFAVSGGRLAAWKSVGLGV